MPVRSRTPRAPVARARRRTVVAVLTAALVALPLVPATMTAAAAQGMTFSPRGHLVIHARGNGHGHGMSQYGARGAAQDGLSYRHILAFYYRHTRLVTARKRVIRVLLSDFGSATTVRPYRGMWVTGMRHPLPVHGFARYRLVADAHRGLTLERRRYGRHARWHAYRRGLRDHASFFSPKARATRIYAPNGSSNYYYGHLVANRSAARGRHGVYTVDRVNLDHYVAGVAPREMPATWPHAAIRAQAVAARTYGLYAIEHPRARHYDICDTTDCQFYGGRSYYDPGGNRLWTDDMPVAKHTAYQVLSYHGQVAFTQFSASDGGWTVGGDQPYLVARRDPYDSHRAGDPYIDMRRRVSLARLARSYGFGRLTDIELASRDGHGVWGGRVGTVHLKGLSGGRPKRVTVSGSDFGAQFGYGTNWLHLSRTHR